MKKWLARLFGDHKTDGGAGSGVNTDEKEYDAPDDFAAPEDAEEPQAALEETPETGVTDAQPQKVFKVSVNLKRPIKRWWALLFRNHQTDDDAGNGVNTDKKKHDASNDMTAPEDTDEPQTALEETPETNGDDRHTPKSFFSRETNLRNRKNHGALGKR